jgi:hypothetical protein
VDQVEVSHGSRQPSIRLQVLPTVFYLQGWMPRGLDQVLIWYPSDRILRTNWLLLLEEYGVTFEYLPGKKNVGNVADVLSRLDIDSLKIQEDGEEK